MTTGLIKIKSILFASARRLTGWIPFFLSLACGFPLQSCMENGGVEYSSFVDIGNDGIPPGWEYEFTPIPADSSSIGKIQYDVILVVRYSTECSSKDMLLDIEEFSLEQAQPDSISVKIPLFNSANEPLGKGIYSIYETSDTIMRKKMIPEGYSLSISSHVAQEETKGIKAIGVVLSRSDYSYENPLK